MAETKEDTKASSSAPVDASKPQQQPPNDIAFDEDAFEEFDNEDWNIVTHDEENQDLWQADWDDEDPVAEGDFTERLKGELKQAPAKTAMTA